MADQDTIRKLAAIMSADVVGYSRLMGEDEQATIATLSAYRNVFKDTIAAHQGRVVDTAGDSVLVVFTSVVEAVQSAVEVQQALQARNDALPAAPGGLCIAGSVYDTVQTKLGLPYEALGEQSVKNIRHPVRAYRVRPQPAATAPCRGLARRVRAWGQRRVTWGVVVLLLVSGAVVPVQAVGSGNLQMEHTPTRSSF